MNSTRLALSMLALVAAWSAFAEPHAALAQRREEEVGAVEGAIWRYEMTSVVGKGDTRRGRFRIFGEEIFQGAGGESVVIGTIEGKFDPGPKARVKATFNKLRGDDGQSPSFHGWVRRGDKPGTVTARLIDANGFHWNFKAERVRE